MKNAIFEVVVLFYILCYVVILLFQEKMKLKYLIEFVQVKSSLIVNLFDFKSNYKIAKDWDRISVGAKNCI